MSRESRLTTRIVLANWVTNWAKSKQTIVAINQYSTTNYTLHHPHYRSPWNRMCITRDSCIPDQPSMQQWMTHKLCLVRLQMIIISLNLLDTPNSIPFWRHFILKRSSSLFFSERSVPLSPSSSCGLAGRSGGCDSHRTPEAANLCKLLFMYNNSHHYHRHQPRPPKLTKQLNSSSPSPSFHHSTALSAAPLDASKEIKSDSDVSRALPLNTLISMFFWTYRCFVSFRSA